MVSVIWFMVSLGWALAGGSDVRVAAGVRDIEKVLDYGIKPASRNEK